MPSRFVSLAILIYWSIAAFLLLDLGRDSGADAGVRARFESDRRCRRFEQAGAVEHPGRGRSAASRTCAGPWANRSRPRRGGLTAGCSSRTTSSSMPAACSEGLRLRSRPSARVGVESLYLVDQSGNLNSFDLQRRRQGPADC